MTGPRATSKADRIVAAAWLAACLLLPGLTLAQGSDLRLPVSIDADETDYDGKRSMLRFTGLRLTQGGISIRADVAHASRMDFDDSIWHFSGNVVFDVDQGHVECDSADLQFADFQLQLATIEGAPATFEFKRDDSEEMTVASANKLYYDVRAGVIEFSGNASINEGGNQISSESLVYNISEQRINAVASGDGANRVKVRFTPPAESDKDPASVPNAPDDDPDADSDTAPDSGDGGS